MSYSKEFPSTVFDRFVDAYISAALWATNDQSDEAAGEPLDRNYCADDIAPEALETIRRDCGAFLDANAETIRGLPDSYECASEGAGPIDMAGHDFFLTRCGHGVGFWDRGIGV